jgi:SnoaL-like domain
VSDLRQIIDRTHIIDVANRYASGLDRRDWQLLRSIFTDEIDMEFGSVGIRSGRYEADRWVRNSEVLFAGFGPTQHTLTNHAVTIDGDAAHTTVYMQAEHFIVEDAPADNRWTIGGWYEHDLERRGDGWLIHRMALYMTWQTGNRELSQLAIERGRRRLGLPPRRTR